ncbi:Serine/threonine-protein phosphatase 4 regulatory subunit 1 [Camelus dromedarius]|uniref:Serine/threonine-protein phosphatase 4 regulatory subunit 1 n=1 Tax=Camelus dromedarius TaxID=9838 RepID=A0A5N4CI25_CAMDR|nr:Serine/threonine-protein phosphatase 4 regulatory subunit 1 [Camelus dromedarius]
MSLIVGVDACSSESDVVVVPSALDFVSQDEMLTPLGRLDKYAASDNVFNRQMVARSLLDTLREVCDDERDCIAVLERISRLADDSEPTVRAELMEQVPHIALFCQENRPAIPYAFSKYLLPIVVRYLADQNNQVRKTSQAALLALLEQELIERFDVETKVCPVLVGLTAPDSTDDVKTEAVAIMCRMAPMVGKDITERLILPRFCEMCCDCRMFHVRKVCAANFGDICSVVGQQATEEMLVRQAAFQSLGPFISTFANPSSSGQYFKEESKKPPQEAASDEKDRKPGHGRSASRLEEPGLLDQEYNSFHFWRTPLPEIDLDMELGQGSGSPLGPEGPGAAPQVSVPGSASLTMATRKELEELIENLEPHVDDPDVRAQVDVLAAALRASSLDACDEPGEAARRSPVQDEPAAGELPGCGLSHEASVPLISDAVEDVDSALCYMHHDPDLGSDGGFSPDEERRPRVQDVVPQALLDQYLSMTDPSRAQTVDTEIAKHCAYSLPGVALTLGRQNWHCLRETYETLASDMQVGGQARGTYETLASDMQVGGQARGTYETLASDMQVGGQARGTYETLASDMQWKVRRTLAFSIHELAVILGDQLTAADLVPIFNGFLKDLDEVRIGVLKHLHDFLKLLHVDKRREYLYQLQEFLVTDNSRNWRFRAELAEQLILLLELYSPRDVYDYLRPIALSLCADKVSSVRWISYKLVSEMVRKLHRAAPPSFGVDLIHELVENFGRCPRWSGRQAFVFVCQTVIEDDCLPMDQFALHLMPHLLTLANDRVPNVRVLLAKTLRQTLLEKEYFSASASCHQEAVEQTIVALQMDRDSDVKYFASTHPAGTRISEDALSTASSTY